MWIQVRTMDGKRSARIDSISKLTKLEDLREILSKQFDVPANLQRLFYRGKQMEDGHTLHDYNVGLNEIIQLMIRESCSSKQSPIKGAASNGSDDKENRESASKESLNSKEGTEQKQLSKYYKLQDLVDAKVRHIGAWFEGQIINIKQNEDSKEDEDELLYTIKFDDSEDFKEADLKLSEIRPRARKLISFADVKVGDRVLANYNAVEPHKRGFWYDLKITDIDRRSTKRVVTGYIFVGEEEKVLKNCKVLVVDELLKIEKNVPMDGETDHSDASTTIRKSYPECDHCQNVIAKKCKHCSCHVCGGKDQADKQILCDECNLPFHFWCLDPPLEELPQEEEDWYCPDCKNDKSEVILPGEKLKMSKRKSKAPSAQAKGSRDWGKGMACVGRTKECTLVPPNHFGPIPGVEVGTLWKFRVQVSESGVHRPPVGGIHGREHEGAYSIVLSGGYEDDQDDGDEFTYTGSGGRDLSGNKRCAEQSCDQTLTRMNMALALNCDAPSNKEGAEAKDWRNGKPVRVVRNCKGRKHSKYAPEDGNRYDGIYKVVKYWPEKGKSGFMVWRYMLRRDDDTPAPWTKKGKKRCEDLNLTMQYPPGYKEAEDSEMDTNGAESSSKGKKRPISNGDSKANNKKRKSTYALDPTTQSLIEMDTVNKKLWDDCLVRIPDGPSAFRNEVQKIFSCVCCQEIAFSPITTSCGHNTCRPCLEMSFDAQTYACPVCRHKLDRDCLKQVNETLNGILKALFPIQ